MSKRTIALFVLAVVVIIVASLCDTTYANYEIGFPRGGRWLEAFNSDVYDHWVNPEVAGNGGQIDAGGAALHGFPTSAALVIPANGVLLFTLDAGE